MILYNITVNIDQDVEKEWVQWMKATHIPKVMETGLFNEFKFYKLLHEMEGGGVNYSVQYFAESMDHVLDYQNNHDMKIHEVFNQKYNNKYALFRSVLEQV
ncbi:DUF4286 family protein [Echinicola sp. 20G]|uniref:DUF4286 family protein n=1 Tax=Echinicola sp. 20G TaxID=2781961 RepID=UPI00190FFEF6|nr:DUF4286 family protein [Echinicola sp. 20G]